MEVSNRSISQACKWKYLRVGQKSVWTGLALGTALVTGMIAPATAQSVEAFYKGVPVVARAAAAVPATMDAAGVLYETRDPREVAALMHAVAVQRLIVHASLEEDVDVALPREPDAAVQLHRTIRHVAAGGGGGALRHAGRRPGRIVAGIDRRGRVVEQ